jgi:mRNA interferase RelE/StbE
MPWTLIVAPVAERTLGRVSERVAGAIGEFVLGPLRDEPTRVGKPLQRELSGYWSARRGAYRIIYAIDEERREIRVVRIDHRSDLYRPR